MKKNIRLNEAKTKKIISESMKKVLKENSFSQEEMGTIEEINKILEDSGCGEWELEHETTLYLSDKDRKEKGYDCITYYRGGYDYPKMCFVKERLVGNNYGTMTERVDYATPEEFLDELKKQRYFGGMWRPVKEDRLDKIVTEAVKKVLKEHRAPEGGYADYEDSDIQFNSVYEQAKEALAKARKAGKPIASVLDLIEYQGWQPRSFNQTDWETLYDANEQALAESGSYEKLDERRLDKIISENVRKVLREMDDMPEFNWDNDDIDTRLPSEKVSTGDADSDISILPMTPSEPEPLEDGEYYDRLHSLVGMAIYNTMQNYEGLRERYKILDIVRSIANRYHRSMRSVLYLTRDVINNLHPIYCTDLNLAARAIKKATGKSLNEMKISEKDLMNIISESIKEVWPGDEDDEKGMYGYPKDIDALVLLTTNDKECMKRYDNIARAVKKKQDKGIELSVDILANSSVMKKLQQLAFRKFRSEQEGILPTTPYNFRRFMSERMIDDIHNY